MKAVNKFNLKLGKLSLPMSCYKAVDNTTSVWAKEVTKINGKIYKVQRKPFVVLDNGEELEVDKTQIYKAYEKDNGEMALFTKDEQSQLLKKGSSREWEIQAVTDRTMFDELSFQKDGIVAMPELDKKKELLNKKNLKWFAMLKAGLSEKVMVAQILYKNVEYPVAITNMGDKLLIRFIHYKEEIREMGEVELPELTEQEKEQARAFVNQHYKPDFDVGSFENKTYEQTMKLINSRGQEVEDSKVEETIEMENPFEL